MHHSTNNLNLSTYYDDTRALLYLIRSSYSKEEILQFTGQCHAVIKIRINEKNPNAISYYEIYSDESSKKLSSLVSFGWVSINHTTSFAHCLLSYTYNTYI